MIVVISRISRKRSRVPPPFARSDLHFPAFARTQSVVARARGPHGVTQKNLQRIWRAAASQLVAGNIAPLIKGSPAMWRQHRSISAACAVLFLCSCARPGVDTKVSTTSDTTEEAKASDVVVTGSRMALPTVQYAPAAPMVAMEAPP